MLYKMKHIVVPRSCFYEKSFYSFFSSPTQTLAVSIGPNVFDVAPSQSTESTRARKSYPEAIASIEKKHPVRSISCEIGRLFRFFTFSIFFHSPLLPCTYLSLQVFLLRLPTHTVRQRRREKENFAFVHSGNARRKRTEKEK